jgi:hypothetical protein
MFRKYVTPASYVLALLAWCLAALFAAATVAVKMTPPHKMIAPPVRPLPQPADPVEELPDDDQAAAEGPCGPFCQCGCAETGYCSCATRRIIASIPRGDIQEVLYQAARRRALRERRPFVVWVGMTRPAGALPDCVHVQLDAFVDCEPGGVVVALPRGGDLVRVADLARPSVERIRALTAPPRQIVFAAASFMPRSC